MKKDYFDFCKMYNLKIFDFSSLRIYKKYKERGFKNGEKIYFKCRVK